MLTMIPKRIRVSGFTRGRDKYTDAQVAALIEDLDLVPALLITPSLVKAYRIEVREQLNARLAEKENVRRAVEYSDLFLCSERGKLLTKKWDKAFQLVLPLRGE